MCQKCGIQNWSLNLYFCWLCQAAYHVECTNWTFDTDKDDFVVRTCARCLRGSDL